MRKQDINNIEVGFRQLTFGFEKNNSKEQDRIMYYIKDQTETYGHVVLDEFVQYVRELHELSESLILQNIFWFVRELKIHLKRLQKIFLN